MPTDFKFHRFRKGWFYNQRHLVGLDGFDKVINFVVYQGGIEKVKGWELLQLNPQASINSFFPQLVINDFDTVPINNS